MSEQDQNEQRQTTSVNGQDQNEQEQTMSVNGQDQNEQEQTTSVNGQDRNEQEQITRAGSQNSSGKKRKLTEEERQRRKEQRLRKKRKKLLISSVILVVLVAVLAVLVISVVRSMMGGNTNDTTAKSSSYTTADSATGQKTTGTPTETPAVTPSVTISVTPENTVTPAATVTPAVTPTGTPAVNLTADMLTSDYACLVRVNDQSVLFDKSANERAYPASVTKIMTAIVAIEHISDLNQRITLSQEMIDELYNEGASMAGFSGGEAPTALDLLYGTLLPSGADACDGLALSIAGTADAFVEMMNQKAQELGMTNTHFVTVSGLHDENHYSTCADMAKLLIYALKDETFRSVFTAKTYTSTPTEAHPEGVYMESTLFSKVDTTTFTTNGGELLGGKTGYTDEAGLCLASLATVHDQEYVFVTMHANGNHYTEQFHIMDAYTAYESIS